MRNAKQPVMAEPQVRLIIDDMNPTRQIMADGSSRLWPDSKVNAAMYRDGKMQPGDAAAWETMH